MQFIREVSSFALDRDLCERFNMILSCDLRRRP
jgi:hypothetical protein